MRSVREMSELIEGQVRDLFSDRARSLLIPVRENGRSLLSSDICIRLARRRAENPAELAKKLLAQIAPESGELWIQHAGFLNISFDDQLLVTPPFQEARSPLCETSIFLPLRPTSLPVASMLRLAAPATLQAWLLHCNGKLGSFCVGETTVDLRSMESLGQVWSAVIELSLPTRANGIDLRERVLDFWRQRIAGNSCFFLFPGDVEQSLWKEGGREAGFDEQVHVFIPERSWIADIDPPPVDMTYLDRSAEMPLALLLHLCGPSRGVDIEWNSPLFSERKNLLWCLSSTKERLLSISGGEIGGEPEFLLPPDLAFLIRFMPTYFSGAMSSGEVLAWVAAMGDLVERVSGQLNDPSLRISTSQRAAPICQLCPVLTQVCTTIQSFLHVD